MNSEIKLIFLDITTSTDKHNPQGTIKKTKSYKYNNP